MHKTHITDPPSQLKCGSCGLKKLLLCVYNLHKSWPAAATGGWDYLSSPEQDPVLTHTQTHKHSNVHLTWFLIFKNSSEDETLTDSCYSTTDRGRIWQSDSHCRVEVPGGHALTSAIRQEGEPTSSFFLSLQGYRLNVFALQYFQNKSRFSQQVKSSLCFFFLLKYTKWLYFCAHFSKAALCWIIVCILVLDSAFVFHRFPFISQYNS